MKIRKRTSLSRAIASMLILIVGLAGLSTPAGAAVSDDSWSTPVDLSEAGESAVGQQIASSADGAHLTIVWMRQDNGAYRVQASTSHDSGATWSTPVSLSPVYRAAYSPQITSSSDGTRLAATWSLKAVNGFRRVQVASSTDSGASWSTPVFVSEDGQNAYNPQIATSIDGTRLATAWRRTDGSHVRVQAATSADSGASWSTPITLSEGGADAIKPQITSSIDGTRLSAAWEFGDYSHARVQVASSTDSGASWSTPVTLSEDGGDAHQPQITSSADGTHVTATWERHDGTYYRVQAASSTDSGASWSTPVTLSEDGQNAIHSRITSSPDGARMATAWVGQESSLVVKVATSDDSGATWSTPVMLSEDGQSVQPPSITSSADGTHLAATWSRFDGSYYRVQAASSTDSGASWSTPVTLSAAGRHAYNPQTTNSIDGTHLAATWNRYDASYNARVQVSIYPVQADAVPPAVEGSTDPETSGWVNTAVTVSWTAVDDVDGPLPAPGDVVLESEGAGQVATSDEVCDSAGNCATGTVTGINIDLTDPTVGQAALGLSPLPVGYATTVSATAADGLSGVAGGEWFLGTEDPGEGHGTPLIQDGGTLSGAVPAGGTAGVFPVSVRAVDAAGNWSQTSTVYLVVYDPSAGFATGGGWLVPGGTTSDAGDVLPGLDGQSKANFGFVVKYQNGSSAVPGGNLQFHYKAGDFKLKSSGMEWLVVTNSNWAKFQGMGHVDGMDGLVPFRVDARDDSTQGDRFVIRIWAPDANPDVDDAAYKASGNVEGGQIKIHKQ